MPIHSHTVRYFKPILLYSNIVPSLRLIVDGYGVDHGFGSMIFLAGKGIQDVIGEITRFSFFISKDAFSPPRTKNETTVNEGKLTRILYERKWAC
ncbi:unnamed protein product [Lathyrus oleraceus]